jgi:hypothetical protein
MIPLKQKTHQRDTKMTKYTKYARFYAGLEFWAYMQSPGSVFSVSGLKPEQSPPSEYLMSCGTEG